MEREEWRGKKGEEERRGGKERRRKYDFFILRVYFDRKVALVYRFLHSSLLDYCRYVLRE